MAVNSSINPHEYSTLAARSAVVGWANLKDRKKLEVDEGGMNDKATSKAQTCTSNVALSSTDDKTNINAF